MKSRRQFDRRRGMTLLEVGVALVILAAAMATLVQLVGIATRQLRTTDQRSAALHEVANEAERLATIPWSELAPDKLTTWQPSAELKSVLPAAECRVTVGEEHESPRARRIDLRVAWKNAVGDKVKPVEVTFWRYAPEDQP